MDSFEFAQIPVAIIIGFGVSEILTGSGTQIRQRASRPLSPPHVVAIAAIPPELPIAADTISRAVNTF